MAHDILDQIRIVSNEYPFPIWINNQPILLKLGATAFSHIQILPIHCPSLSNVVNSEPNLKWVLIIKDTYVEFQPPSSGANSTLSTPTSSSLMSPLRAPSGGSTSSEVSDHFSQAQQHQIPGMPQRQLSGVYTKQPTSSSNFGHRSSFSDPVFDPHPGFCSPATETDESIASSQNESYGIVPNIPQLMQGMIGYFFRRDQTLHPHLTKDDRKKSLSSERPRFGRDVSPSKTYHAGMTGQHVRQQSWSFSQKEVAERHLPLYVSTPEFDAPLRVQVPPTSGEALTWSTSQCFDVFVHPLSLPDLYHSFVMSKTTHKEISFLVQLCVDCCIVPSDGKRDGGRGNGKSASTTWEKQDSQVPEKSEESEKDMLEVMSGIWKGFTRKTQATQAASGNSRPQLQTPTPQCRVAVARLIFATHVQFGRKLQTRSSLEEAMSRENSYSSVEDSFSTSHQVIPPNSIAIVPGHVMMSGVLQRQLGLKVNSPVRLLHVKEQWRILSSFYKVSVKLTPITNSTVSIGTSSCYSF